MRKVLILMGVACCVVSSMNRGMDSDKNLKEQVEASSKKSSDYILAKKALKKVCTKEFLSQFASKDKASRFCESDDIIVSYSPKEWKTLGLCKSIRQSTRNKK